MVETSPHRDPNSPAERTCDVLVVGSGAAGFTAAISARLMGLDVLMVEKAPRFGGTTARSGGIPWIPGNPYQAAAGGPDDPAEARRYLRSELGNRYDDALIEAYLDSGPEMIAFLTEHGAIASKALAPFPDYHSDVAGAALGGRGVRPLPYDGRRLGHRFADLEWPIGETMLRGRMTINSEHMAHYYNVAKSLKSFLFVAARLLRYARDRLSGYPRGTEIAGGNALIGRLAEKAFALDIPLLLSTPITRLTSDGARIVGAVSASGPIHARRGVVLATGGFSGDAALRERYFPANTAGENSWTLTTPGVAGDAARLAMEAGGTLNANMAQPVTWLPMSRVPRSDGSEGLFPHLIDRNKPGFIAVGQDARRFANESSSYQDFTPRIAAALADAARQEAYLICDHRALRKYGIGPVRPAPVPFGKWLRNGYLVTGRNLSELAERLGLDAASLVGTVARFNAGAGTGTDPEFGRGSTAYQRAMGDPSHTPNPSLGPLVRAPFYAVRLVPGDIGTSIGLSTDAEARVLDADGKAIVGLYAVGNDMANPTVGVYPGPGVTLGPAMTFAWRAARHLATAREQFV
ncbi:MAG: FAD-dependent oxidoreductase [Sphingopyxis sp.]|uniref:FAD-dependent oxidoreductase n=1 Tax=Sphingopyxis sp. TaxID=1908224 RepID=UPI001A224E04|nr:FAD-dependent oxidoreductase [Sphingopyxis sp.]MBJ7498632.1 FAD-dependent oxidoreductase [Sphingopyxis sp.]